MTPQQSEKQESPSQILKNHMTALAITDGKRQLPSILPLKRKSSTANFCHQSFIYKSL